jgi:DNA-binding MltR family transcriptional regulator
MQTLNKLTQITNEQFADLSYSEAYANYLMENYAEVVFCKDALLDAMEDLYAFKDFIATLGLADTNEY